MSFRGGGGRGFGRGGGGGGFRGRGGGGGGGSFGRGGGGGYGRGGFNRGYQDQGPPETVVKLGSFAHPCQKDIVVKADIDDVPYFNAPLFLQNKEPIGKVDEIFGNVKDYWISVKLAEGMQAESFEKNTEIYIDPQKLLPSSRFQGDQRGGGRGGGRGGRGGRGGGGRGGRGGGMRGGRGGGGFRGGRGGGGGGGWGRGGGGGGGRGGGRGFGRGRF